MSQQVILCFMLFFLYAQVESRVGRQRRIVGGEEADIEKFPFMAALEYVNGQICGGAILNENWVLTAAHCFGKVFRPDVAVIRVGTDIRQHGGTEHEIIGIRKYPNFLLKVVDNDVALMKVMPTLKFSDKVRSIKLPESSQTPKVGDMLTVLGWGYTKERGNPSEKLRMTSIPVFPHDECKKIYNDTLNVTPQMLCVGYNNGGKDACILDSGGPLVSNYTLMGVVSWGWGCARAHRPGVYTDLTAPQVKNWILSIIDT